MGEWHISYCYHLSLLLAVLCLLGLVIGAGPHIGRSTATAAAAAAAEKSRGGDGKQPQQAALTTTAGHTAAAHSSVPTLDGSALYYERARWPVYDARFNFRLSLLHGPVVCVKQGTTSIFSVLVQWTLSSSNFLLYAITGQQQQQQRRRSAANNNNNTNTTTILVNSLAGDDGTLKALLSSCASRAPSITAGKYLSRGRRIVLMPYGPEWIRHRKAFAGLLTREKVRTLWAAALRVEAMVLVERLADVVVVAGSGSGVCGGGDATLGGSKRVVDEISRFTASTVLQIAYARRAATPEDPLLKDLEVVSKNIASAFRPGWYWVESFALLDVFPAFLAPWKRKLNANHEFEASLFGSLLEDVEARLSNRGYCSNAPSQQQQPTPEIITPVEDCAAAQLLRGQACHGLDRDAIAYLAAGLFEAGTETTAMTINTFLLGAASNPAATRRAQTEMDELMVKMRVEASDDNADGKKKKNKKNETVPGFEDLVGLPILAAFVKEALRLTPAGASGVGHTRAGTRGPQTYNLSSRKGNGGQSTKRLDVPNGTTVLANIYGLHHDSAIFRDPWLFDPNRWLSDSDPAACTSGGQPPCRPVPTTRTTRTLDHTHACFAFGFGKRICPGSTLACYSLTMAIALLLLCFDFSLTDAAQRIYTEMKDQNDEEYLAWARLFGDRGREAIAREEELREGGSHRPLGGQGQDEEEKIGSVLIDAHVAFKLSRAQVAECVRLVLREEGVGLAVVRDALAAVRG